MAHPFCDRDALQPHCRYRENSGARSARTATVSGHPAVARGGEKNLGRYEADQAFGSLRGLRIHAICALNIGASRTLLLVCRKSAPYVPALSGESPPRVKEMGVRHLPLDPPIARENVERGRNLACFLVSARSLVATEGRKSPPPRTVALCFENSG